MSPPTAPPAPVLTPDSPPQAPPPSANGSLHLTVLGDATDPNAGPATALFAFGTRSGLAKGHIEHTFTLRNDNAAPIRLDHLQPSCGCTTAVITDGQAATGGQAQADGQAGVNAPAPPVSSVTVAPHQAVSIRISIDPDRLTPGPVEKYVWVYAKGQSEAAAILKTVGTLDAGAQFSPASLDFGRVTAERA